MKIFTVVESTNDDGAIEVKTFATKANAIKHWTKCVKANIGTRFDPNTNQEEFLPQEEIQEELYQAVQRNYVWAGWDTKVELFTNILN